MTTKTLEAKLKISAFVLLVFLLSSCSSPNYAPVTSTSEDVADQARESIPNAPSNLVAEVISSSIIRLSWVDNSNNERAFRIYRNNDEVATVPENVTVYQDSGLKQGTTYRYTVIASNQTGKSPGSSFIVRIPNPPITVKLDRIGVYDNRENFLRGRGEVYVYIVVSDGNTVVEKRFPVQEGQHYSLDKNETVYIGETLFSVSEVGDLLTITAIGYESDGGSPFEQLVVQALGAAIEMQIAGAAGGLLNIFGIGIGGLIAQFLGTEDDFLGSYEQTWGLDNNWGVGIYVDIALEDDRGILCLRLWFTIETT